MIDVDEHRSYSWFPVMSSILIGRRVAHLLSDASRDHHGFYVATLRVSTSPNPFNND